MKNAATRTRARAQAFNTIGVEHMEDPSGRLSNNFPGGTDMMFAGSEDAAALSVATAVVRGVGFNPVFVGPIRYARNLEAIAELWIHMAVCAVCGGVGRGVACANVGAHAHTAARRPRTCGGWACACACVRVRACARACGGRACACLMCACVRVVCVWCAGAPAARAHRATLDSVRAARVAAG
jgi:hypothetical protein